MVFVSVFPFSLCFTDISLIHILHIYAGRSGILRSSKVNLKCLTSIFGHFQVKKREAWPWRKILLKPWTLSFKKSLLNCWWLLKCFKNMTLRWSNFGGSYRQSTYSYLEWMILYLILSYKNYTTVIETKDYKSCNNPHSLIDIFKNYNIYNAKCQNTTVNAIIWYESTRTNKQRKRKFFFCHFFCSLIIIPTLCFA